MIDPVIDAFTSPVSPSRNARAPMMSSAALPKVAFSNAPIPGPSRFASASVACPMYIASGRIASTAVAKIAM
jgi:hypothetical protein